MTPDAPPTPWWQSAVVYQVYLRSFADGSGDGTGDIRGLLGRLPHVVDLGADAVWLSPWFRSPMHDGGYDIADYRDIDPTFGSMDDALAAHRGVPPARPADPGRPGGQPHLAPSTRGSAPR